MIFLPTFVQKKTLCNAFFAFHSQLEQPLVDRLCVRQTKIEPNSTIKSARRKYRASNPSGKFRISSSSFEL